MKTVSLLTAVVSYILISCLQPISPVIPQQSEEEQGSLIKIDGESIVTRFATPTSYERTHVSNNSFGEYLRNLPLKPNKSLALKYDGSKKANHGIYHAVVNLAIGDRDLHQCADAIMRLRAEYFFDQEEYDQIHFNFTNGFNAEYTTWRAGNRIKVLGNKVSWTPTKKVSDTAESFWKYLEMVFSYAGTASLSKELQTVSLSKMKIGDVFIQGGFPGHAVIVTDMCEQPETGKQLFMLAQSYMPAQEIQILQNPSNLNISPWYEIDFGETLRTPEWTFNSTDLKSF